MRCFSIVVLLICTLATSVFGLNIDTEVSWIDFNGYDHTQAANGGQSFPDVYDDIDVVVTASGDFTLPTTQLGFGRGLISQNAVPSFQRFDFTLSKPSRVVVRYTSTDDYENLDVLALSVRVNNRERGAPPVITNIPGGWRITGTANTLKPNGAAGGYVVSGTTSAFAVRHEALAEFKYEAIQIGIVTTPVPEPSGSWLAAVAFPAFMLSVRRQQRRQARRPCEQENRVKSSQV